MPQKILILGLGNVLMGNEGVGVRAIEYLNTKTFPPNVSLIDGGTGGFHLLSLFSEYDRFILIDATLSTEKAGAINIIQPKFASDFPRSLTSHDIGLRDLMQSAELIGQLKDITLITVNIKELDHVKIGLSPELEMVMDDVYKAVWEILEELLESKSIK